jgi:hypothetical protein
VRSERRGPRGEERLGQGVERVPAPRLDLLGLEHLRLSAHPVGGEGEVDVVLRRVRRDVHHAQEAEVVNLEPRLFSHLPARAVGEGLEVLEVASG